MAILEVYNLHMSFKSRTGNSRVDVLKGINFTLNEGEVLAILGSSGGGKTTLLRCLNLLELPDKGTIKVAGDVMYDAARQAEKPMKESELSEKRLHMGLVFQSFNLFPQYTVLKNLMLAPTLLKKGTPEEIETKAKNLLDQVGLTEKISYYPCQLSGGQSQRVAIARALMLEPDILCFDEPTSALDPELTGEVLKAIRNLKGTGRTMIIVTHEMDFARDVSDKVLFIHKGQIHEQGPTRELFANPQTEELKNFLSH